MLSVLLDIYENDATPKSVTSFLFTGKFVHKCNVHNFNGVSFSAGNADKTAVLFVAAILIYIGINYIE